MNTPHNHRSEELRTGAPPRQTESVTNAKSELHVGRSELPTVRRRRIDFRDVAMMILGGVLSLAGQKGCVEFRQHQVAQQERREKEEQRFRLLDGALIGLERAVDSAIHMEGLRRHQRLEQLELSNDTLQLLRREFKDLFDGSGFLSERADRVEQDIRTARKILKQK